MPCLSLYTLSEFVAPPRGERGLKSLAAVESMDIIEVAPPRGERGLKYLMSP